MRSILPMRNIRQSVCSIALFLAVAIQARAGTETHAAPSESAGHVRAKFIHPGIPFTREDLEALKARLDQPPWKSGFDSLANDGHSQLSYRMQGPCAEVKRAPNVNLNQWRNDMIAVHNLSLMWWFTGKPDYSTCGAASRSPTAFTSRFIL